MGEEAMRRMVGMVGMFGMSTDVDKMFDITACGKFVMEAF